jgi:hypothetical protein
MFDAGTAVLKTIPKFNGSADKLTTTNLANNSNEKSNTRTASSAPGETENVLNRYRNVTYNLTLAALTPDNLKNPDGYRNGKLKYIISSSKGKGSAAISADITARRTDITEETTTYSDFGDEVKKTTVIGAKEDFSAKEIVQEFNRVSPGKFEMFIDGLEVETLLAPNKQTGPAIATKVKFEIFEPMSANGFIEALHVSALAAGWTGYLNACYVLKLDFIGYPDDDPGPVSDATTINATRYFPIKLTGTEMEVTETGTKYRVSAVPFNESGFANPNVIYTDTSFSGNTVKEVIESLFEGINKSTKERAAKEKSPEAAKIVDEYQVFFPEIPKSGESLKIETVDTEISKAKINEQLRSNAVYKFPPIEQSPNATPAGGGRGSANDPRRTDAGEIPKRYDPQKNQIQFSANSNIHEIIEAVIRDSLYFEKVLKDVEAAKKGDGMIDYFQVMINTVPGPMDTTFNQQRFIYQYIICPYKVHYSKLPGQQNSNFDSATMKNYTKRIYNYLYTGNNIDVLSFRLNFNNLFFQAANPKMGNNDKSDTSSGAGASNDPSVKAPTDGAKNAPKDQNDRAPALPSGEAGSTNGRGQPIQQNPYYQIAYAAHQAILESVNMLTGEIEILGDPFYLATGGMGNHLPKLKDYAITTTGEANFNNGPVVVRINFRNPIDIDEATGLATFSKTAVPFSGVYQVLKCQSTLRDGSFKQKLNIMRYNGQIAEGSDLKPTKAQQNIQENKPGEQQVIDKAPADVARAGVKPNEINLASWIDKGLPTNGLPGQFANLLGGVNQSLKTVTGALGPAANVLNNIGNLAGGLGIGDALTGINPLSKGIPISAQSVSALVSDKLSAGAAGLNQVGNQLKSLVPGNVNGLINVQSAQDASSILTGISNAGSRVINGVSKDIGSIVDKAGAGVSNLLEVGKGLGDTSGLVSGVQNKIANINSLPSSGLTSLQRSAVIQDAIDKGIPPDQALRNAELFGVNLPGVEAGSSAIASKLGIDVSQLSGLTGKLDSKLISELQDVASNLPSNVNLSSIKEQGIILANIGKDALKNIPAAPPKSVAPAPQLPFTVKADSLSPEVRANVIKDAVAKGIPVDQALRNAALFGEGALSKIGPLESLTAFGKSVADSAFGKISSIQSGLTGLVGAQGALKSGLTTAMGVKGSLESQISSVQNMLGNPQLGTTQLANLGKSVSSQFGSLSASVASPLEKFMNNSVNSLNDPNAPPYTGTDPIVRRRLGLPPIEEA